MEKTFNILIATIGRPTLQNILNSLVDQLNSNDCLTIVYDGHNSIPKFNISKFKCKVNQYIEPVALKFWGHGIRNKYASLLEKKDFIMHGDDDNIYLPNVFNYLRSNCMNNDCLYICKVSTNGNLMPTDKSIKVGNIDTGCGIIPYELNKKSTWKHIFGGDGMFYEELAKQAIKIEFFNKIIYEIRPLQYISYNNINKNILKSSKYKKI